MSSGVTQTAVGCLAASLAPNNAATILDVTVVYLLTLHPDN